MCLFLLFSVLLLLLLLLLSSILLFNGFFLFEMNIFLISKYPYSLRLSRGKIWLKCFFNSHVKHYLQHRTTITTFPVYSCQFSNLDRFFLIFPSTLNSVSIFFLPLSSFFLFALLKFAPTQLYVYVNVHWPFLFWFF